MKKMYFYVLIIIATLSVLSACDKKGDEKIPKDFCLEIKNEITALKADSAYKAQAVRNAIELAFIEPPEGIRSFYDYNLANVNPMNIQDSVVKTQNIIYELENSWSVTDPEKKHLSAICEEFMEVVDKLNVEYAKQKELDCK